MVDILLSSFLVYWYWLLFGICILAAFGFPLPATALLIAGWALSVQGYFDIMYLFFAGFAGCMIGDMLGYELSYRYGKWVFVRMGFGRFIDIEKLLTKHGPGFIKRSILSVFISRWAVTALWPSVNIIAWLTKMGPMRFIFTDIVGEILYVTIYITIGYSFGTQWEEILDIIESFSSMILSLVLLGVGSYFFWRYSQKKENEMLLWEGDA